MNTENTKYLLEKYPVLYQQYYLPVDQTCMCWGFECGDGWFNIIDELSKKIVEISPNAQVIQVKEKFGGLRFYLSHVDKDVSDKVYELVNKAEDMSYKTCEVCGSTENVTQTRGWISTLCELCMIEHNQQKR